MVLNINDKMLKISLTYFEQPNSMSVILGSEVVLHFKRGGITECLYPFTALFKPTLHFNRDCFHIALYIFNSSH
jgi:hypothetical protein